MVVIVAASPVRVSYVVKDSISEAIDRPHRTPQQVDFDAGRGNVGSDGRGLHGDERIAINRILGGLDHRLTHAEQLDLHCATGTVVGRAHRAAVAE